MNSDTSVNNAADAGQPAETPPDISLWSRLFNVLAAPAEVFDQVKASRPCTANWLVPAILFVLVGWVGTVLVLTQPAIKEQLLDLQTKGFQKQVEKGKMTQQQADAARPQVEKFATIATLVGGIVGSAVAAFASPFWGALLIWLLGAKALKGSFSYMKAVEVAGLAQMVDVLGGIVKTLLILVMANLFAGANALLFLKDIAPETTLFSVLAALDLFAFWLIVVRAIGMSRLSGAGLGVCLVWMLSMWAVFTALAVGLGAAIRAVTGG
jgi:hypothetical protein